MTPKQLVVVGASAGGLEALRTLTAGLPDTFPAAICVVLHTSPELPGVLGDILERSGVLRASSARDGERIVAGHIYVAPPDRHLLVEPGRLRVTKGPREHGFRPAIDPLFRSAAQVFGPSVIGVVLTGNLDDGTAGLWTVKKLGGTAIVQDPDQALFPSMPQHALKHVDVDHVVKLSQMPALLVELTSEAPEVTVQVHSTGPHRHGSQHRQGTEPAGYGPRADRDAVAVGLRCHTGHAYSAESLLAGKNEGIERAMNTARRSLVECSLFMQQMGTRHYRREASSQLLEGSERAKHTAEALRELIRGRESVPTADD